MDVNGRIMQRIDRMVQDIDTIGSIVRTTEEELASVLSEDPGNERWHHMRSRLSEVHARLDGLKEFAIACERRMAGTAQEEEVDIWL